VGGRERMFEQTRRILSNTKALQPIHRVLRPAYYKYVKKRPLINYDRLEVIQHSPYQNIYYCCTQRTGSQWFKKIMRDPVFYQYTGLKVYNYVELGLKQAKFHRALPEGTVGTHLYIGYPTYLSIPKPARYCTFFILRDPRDIAVSWYFAAKYSHRPLDPIPRLRRDLKNLSQQDGLKYSIDSLEEFGLFWAQRSWMNVDQGGDGIRIFRYEDFAKDNRKFLADLFDYMRVAMPEHELAGLSDRYAFKQISGGREAGVEDQHNHYRKGVAGDWQNYFDPSLRRYFREVTGDLLDVLGYPD
jgi:Sulfotransferase domain